MAYEDLGGELRYWRTPSGSEVDFIWTIGLAFVQQGYRGVYREAHTLIEQLADATREGLLADLATRPLDRSSTISAGGSSCTPQRRISWS